MRAALLRQLAAGVVLWFSPAILVAQQVWPNLVERNYIGLQFMRASFEGANADLLNGVAELSLGLGIGPRTRLAFALPYARFSPEGPTVSGSMVGNPYFGVDLGLASGWYGQVGGRIPTASPDQFSPVLVGLSTDWDRAEAFLEDVASLTATAGYRYRDESGLALTGRLGTSAWISTGDASGDSELLAHYGFRASYERQRVAIGIGFTGRALLTEDNAEDRANHQVAFDLEYRADRVVPSVGLRLPLDEPLSSTLNTVVILGVRVIW